MSNHWEKIQTIERDGFIVNTYAAPEDIPIKDHYENDDEWINKVAYKIDHGLCSWFMVKVEAGIEVDKRYISLADDYLGGCLYDDTNDFLGDVYHEDMIKNAIIGARKVMNKITGEKHECN